MDDNVRARRDNRGVYPPNWRATPRTVLNQYSNHPHMDDNVRARRDNRGVYPPNWRATPRTVFCFFFIVSIDNSKALTLICGERGIRTPGTVSSTAV